MSIFQQSAHLQFRAKNDWIFLTNVIEVIQVLFRWIVNFDELVNGLKQCELLLHQQQQQQQKQEQQQQWWQCQPARWGLLVSTNTTAQQQQQHQK